jgi:hypothetical protein
MFPRKPARKSLPRRKANRSLKLFLERLEPRWSPAVFSVSGTAGLIAVLNAAEANADSLSLIKLDTGAYELTNQLIQVAQGKMLAIIGQGQGATTNQSVGQGITATPFAY